MKTNQLLLWAALFQPLLAGHAEACLPPQACAACNGPLCETWTGLLGQAPDPTLWLSEAGSGNIVVHSALLQGPALYMPGSTILYGPAVLGATDLEAEVLLTDDIETRGTLVARVQDRGGDFYYRYQLSVFPGLEGGVMLIRREGDLGVQLGAAATFHADPSCPAFRMRLVVEEFHLRGYVNGVLMVEAEDFMRAYPAGRTGMESYGGAWYDNLRLNNSACSAPMATPPAVPSDTPTPAPSPTATARPTDLPTPAPTAPGLPCMDAAAASNGDLILGGHARVEGPAKAGGQIQTHGSSAITGARTQGQPSILAAWPQPAGAVQLGDLTLSGKEVRVLGAGDYVVGTLKLSAGASLSAQGGQVRLWFKELSLEGQAGLGLSGELRLFGRAGAAGTVKLEGQSRARAAIYAPQHELRMGGSARLEGAVLGSRVELAGGAQLAYDSALGCGPAGPAQASGPLFSASDSKGRGAGAGLLGEREQLRLYPNPAKGLVWASFKLPEQARGRLLVLNLQGELVRMQELYGQAGEGKAALDLRGLAGGAYIGVLQSDSGLGQASKASFKFAVVP